MNLLYYFAALLLILGFNLSSRVRFYVRLILLLIVVMISCVFGLVMVVYLKAKGREREANGYIARCIAVIGPPVLGLSITVEGKENLEGIISNHQSELDLVMMGCLLPPFTVVMAKSDLKWVPLMGQYMMIAQNVFIDRKNLKNALDTMKHVSEELTKRKLALFMYPEGTRSYQTTNELLPFKKIDTTGLTSNDVEALTKSTHELMLKTLREISEPVPSFAEPLKERAPKAKRD
ncbi:1-acylglycerol-3-phosphate O-acyltransferase [Dinochytrium kinnereticum]|nr:1-acylglycerol-3-phosphate O-acyltransferase [Dinochytrium kinnereticum]